MERDEQIKLLERKNFDLMSDLDLENKNNQALAFRVKEAETEQKKLMKIKEQDSSIRITHEKLISDLKSKNNNLESEVIL